jgi:hypothetical protein
MPKDVQLFAPPLLCCRVMLPQGCGRTSEQAKRGWVAGLAKICSHGVLHCSQQRAPRGIRLPPPGCSECHDVGGEVGLDCNPISAAGARLHGVLLCKGVDVLADKSDKIWVGVEVVREAEAPRASRDDGRGRQMDIHSEVIAREAMKDACAANPCKQGRCRIPTVQARPACSPGGYVRDCMCRRVEPPPHIHQVALSRHRSKLLRAGKSMP